MHSYKKSLNNFLFYPRLLRYIKSANAVFTNAESVYTKGDEEQAYIYFLKFFHVYSQLRSTIAYIEKNQAVLVSIITFLILFPLTNK